MTEAAGWRPDPFGRHEVRYWDGAAWTAHVADAGMQGHDEPVPSAEVTPPPPVTPSPAPPAATPAGGGWKDRLKQAAQQGKELAEKGKAELAKQQAQRAAAAANDPDTLWVGEKKSAGTSAIGVSTTRYRITKDKIFVDAGLMSSISEQVPLWAVRDIDVRQNLMQRGKDIGDVVVHLEHPEFHGKSELLLDNIEDPDGVRDLLNRQVSEARAKKQMVTQTQYLQHSGTGFGMAQPPAPASPPGPGVDVADQLRKLAELRDQGVLTEEEFTLQKHRLLGL
ncbi:MAG: PH domain-containing protein [Actinobacteria bacterium]|nr:PH domain-containing protein [Actinomycetota bacterium]